MEVVAHVEAQLAPALRAAWCAATSANPAWTARNPALGQCAVTALIIQDQFGGDLMRGMVDGESHYWNHIDGVDVDLTIAQFGPRAVIHDVVSRDRDYVLSFPETADRYQRLRRRVATIQQVGCTATDSAATLASVVSRG
jgi:hypothetical protein